MTAGITFMLGLAEDRPASRQQLLLSNTGRTAEPAGIFYVDMVKFYKMETLTKSFEKKDKTPQSVKILDQIESARNNADLEKIRELMPDFLAALENDAGIELTPDVHRIYNSIDKGNCIVRLGNFPHITSALAGQDNLKIGNEDENHPNALKGSYEAVKDAFEGGTIMG